MHDPSDDNINSAKALHEAEKAEKEALEAINKGDIHSAKSAIHAAESALHNAEIDLKKPHKIEITVDGKVKHLAGGIYFVNVLKADVGVPADKELDIVKDGHFHPLDDNAEIKIHNHEVFVSHARCGASS